MRIPSIRLWFPALLASLLAACGGSGTTQAVVTSGAITGFGSVYVNGRHFETGSASISRDGAPVSQSELRVGQIVHVSGHVDGNGHAVADSIRQHDNLEGPVSAIDAVAQTFTVLAHLVKVTTETSFDDSLGSFADLTVGLQVEVNGMPDASGAIVATRVELRRAGETHLEVLGTVAALDTVTKHFNIDQLVVDYSAAELEDFDAAGIANGQTVEVKGNALNGSGALIATEVELHDFEHGDDHGHGGHDDGDFQREIEGLVTRFISATDFDISNRPVTTTSATRFEGGSAADLALNIKVEAEGTIDANGVLVATKVEFKRGNGAGLAGLVELTTANATGNGGTLVVMGVTITVDNNTRIEDKSDARVEMFGVKDLHVGDYVEVRGTEPSALHLTASRLERRRPRSDVWVRGTVRDLASPNFTLLGVAVTTTVSTDFEDGNATDFFATAAGRIAKAKGTLVGGLITAREVEFEDNDEGDDDDGDDHGGHGGDDD